MFCCRQTVRDFDSTSDYRLHSSGDCSVSSKDVRSIKDDEYSGETRPSHDIYSCQSSELGQRDFLSSANKMSMSSEQIFNLMKDRVNDRKALEEQTNRLSSNWDIDHRDSESWNRLRSVSHSQDVTAGQLTGYNVEQPLMSSELQFQCSHELEATDVDHDARQQRSYCSHDVDSQGMSVDEWTFHNDLSPSLPGIHQSLAADVNDLTLCRDVQWLDSWTNAAEDSDLRNYTRDY